MFKTFIYFCTLIILLALNIVFPRIAASAPNFLFLLTVIYAFRQNKNEFLWLAFFSGLLLDIFSATFFGTYLLAFLIIAMIINYTTRTFFSADPTVPYIAAVVAVAYLLLVGLIYLSNSIAAHYSPMILPLAGVYLNAKIFIDLLLNLIFAPLVYFLAIFIDNLIAKYQKNSALL